MTGIIYKYTSPSGKSYVGQTVRPKERMAKHRRMEGDCAFHRAIKKYGFDNFKYEVLVTVDLDDEQELKQKLDFFEKFYIRKFHTFGENGYNLTAGGGGTLGVKLSEEAKQNISEVHKGKALSEEHKKHLSEAHKGIKLPPCSEETRRKLSEAGKGRIVSEETKAKLSESHKGHFHSEETKRKMSEARKNPSEETRRKISESQKGRKKPPRSEEHSRKISESNKGRQPWNKGKTMSEELRQKNSEANKLRWELKKQQKSA